jgi:WD40 repeat protein
MILIVFLLGGGLLIAFYAGPWTLLATCGALIGISLGILQRFALRQYGYQIDRWILATTLGWALGVLGWALGQFVSYAVDGIVFYAGLASVPGICVGIAQWRVLRKQVNSTGWWVLANAVGWTVGLVASRTITPNIDVPLMSYFLGLAMAGCIAGAITGVALVRLLPYPGPRLANKDVKRWLVIQFRSRVAGVFWLKWTAVIILGWGLILVLVWITDLGTRLFLEKTWTSVMAQATFGAVSGAFVGALQWLVLRQHPHHSDQWVSASITNWVVGWFLGGAFGWGVVKAIYLTINWIEAEPLTGALVGAGVGVASGALVTLPHRFHLRLSRHRGSQWILASVIGCALGWVLSPGAAGMMAGAMAGMLMGIPLTWLLLQSGTAMSTPLLSIGWRLPLPAWNVVSLVTISLIGTLGLLINDLQPCSWLDKTLKISGCLRTLEGQKDAVTSLAFSPNSTALASGTSEGTVRIWRLGGGIHERTLEGKGEQVNIIAFSPDGATLALGISNGIVQLWRVDDGNLLHTLQGHQGPVNDVAFSLDGATLATVADDRTMQLWKLESGAYLHTLETPAERALNVAFLSDGATLISGAAEQQVWTWRISDAAPLQTPNSWAALDEWKRASPINSMVFAPERTILAVGRENGSVLLWQIGNKNLLHTLTHTHLMSGREYVARVRSIAFAPDGGTLAVGAHDGKIRLWRVADGKLLRSLRHGEAVYSLAFSPDATMLASGAVDGTVRLWYVANTLSHASLESGNDSTGEIKDTIPDERIASALPESPEVKESPSPEKTPRVIVSQDDGTMCTTSTTFFARWTQSMDFPLTAENLALALLEQRILLAGRDASADQVRELLRLFLAVRAERLARHPAARMLDNLLFRYPAGRSPEVSHHWGDSTIAYVERRFAALAEVSEVISLWKNPPELPDARACITYNLFTWDRFFATGDAVGLLMDRAGIAWRPAATQGQSLYAILTANLSPGDAEPADLLAQAQRCFDYPSLLAQVQRWAEMADASLKPSSFDFNFFLETFPLPYDFDLLPTTQGMGINFATGLVEPQIFDFYAAWLSEDGWQQQAPIEAMVTLPHQIWRKDGNELYIEIQGLDDQDRTLVWVEMQLEELQQ